MKLVAWRWLYNGKPDSNKCFPIPGPDADIIKAAAKHSTTVQYLYAENPADGDDTLKLIRELCDLTIINAGPAGMVTAAMKQRASEIQKRLGVK